MLNYNLVIYMEHGHSIYLSFPNESSRTIAYEALEREMGVIGRLKITAGKQEVAIRTRFIVAVEVFEEAQV